jgi:hypothetical protein
MLGAGYGILDTGCWMLEFNKINIQQSTMDNGQLAIDLMLGI